LTLILGSHFMNLFLSGLGKMELGYIQMDLPCPPITQLYEPSCAGNTAIIKDSGAYGRIIRDTAMGVWDVETPH
jgi:hypothetical protein